MRHRSVGFSEQSKRGLSRSPLGESEPRASAQALAGAHDLGQLGQSVANLVDRLGSAIPRAVLLVLDDLRDELALAARDSRLEVIALALHETPPCSASVGTPGSRSSAVQQRPQRVAARIPTP